MRDGMPQQEFAGNCATALHNLGVEGGIFCSFGKYTAFPHGSITPQKLHAGDVVLMDGGCSVEGYQSDHVARVQLLRSDAAVRSEEHTSELQSRSDIVCRLLLEKKK